MSINRNDARIENAALDAVDAIRLAIEGAANDATALAVIQAILVEAPGPDLESDSSVRLFISAVQACGGRFEVVDA